MQQVADLDLLGNTGGGVCCADRTQQGSNRNSTHPSDQGQQESQMRGYTRDRPAGFLSFGFLSHHHPSRRGVLRSSSNHSGEEDGVAAYLREPPRSIKPSKKIMREKILRVTPEIY